MVASTYSSGHHASSHRNRHHHPHGHPHGHPQAHGHAQSTTPPPAPPPPAKDDAPPAEPPAEPTLLERGMTDGADGKIHKVGMEGWGYVEVPLTWRERLYKLALLGAVILPLVPSIILLVFIYKHGPFGGALYRISRDYRSSTQVVVSMVVAVLSYLNIFVISSLFRAVGIVIGENPVFTWLLHNVGLESSSDSADDAPADDSPEAKDAAMAEKIKSGASGESFKDVVSGIFDNKGVTWRVLWVGGVCFALLAVPHIVWTGALTPQNIAWPIPTDQTTQGSYIPIYDTASQFNWANNSRQNPADCDHSYPNTTVYNGCPAVSISSMILTDMGTASGNPTPSKPDYSFSYQGRSYGVGSAAGLFAQIEYVPAADIVDINYIEPGYLTSVSCTKNASSFMSLKTILNTTTVNGVKINPIFGATGKLPNSDWSRDVGNITYTLPARDLDHSVAWIVHSSADQRHTLAIAAGAHYEYLDKIQCEITFTPSQFNVSVNRQSWDFQDTSHSAGTIEVTPRPDLPPPTFDADHLLADTVTSQLNVFAQTQSNGIYSDLGEALTLNIEMKELYATYAAVANDSLLPNPYLLNLSAVAEAVQAAADDVLAFVAASQYYLPTDPAMPPGVGVRNASSVVPALIMAQRVQLGDNSYVTLAMAVTALLIILATINEIVQLVRRKAKKAPTKQVKSQSLTTSTKKKERAEQAAASSYKPVRQASPAAPERVGTEKSQAVATTQAVDHF